MNRQRPDERTIITSSDPEFISELSEYLDVLASPIRLQILSYIGTRPRTVRQISHEIKTSYENTKKHLTKLLSLGIIRKEIGVSDEPVNPGQPVFYYMLVPDGLNHAANNLSIFSLVAGKINPDLSKQAIATQSGLQNIFPAGPGLVIMNGSEQGKTIELIEPIYRVGRFEEGWDGFFPEPALLVDDEYRSVSRVSRPHAWLKKQAGFYTIAEGNSKGGTYVNGKPIAHDPVVLQEGDRIELSPGTLGVTFTFHSGKIKPNHRP
ncbi:MAG: FHA domain-containing protein [Methanomicrobiales archaeon]|nr:FHA domain-containing protein [Methanomicrobiales archaeon]